jgi:hypothetical protein
MYSDESIRERIWRIGQGIPLKLDNITISTNDSGRLLVTGWTNTSNFNNISKETFLRELKDLKSLFSDLSRAFPEFNEILKRKGLLIEYRIAYDDSGKAGIWICSEIEGLINWFID